MTTIKLKNGSGAPAASDLVQGEPAFDLTNKRLYTEDSGGTVIEVGTNPGVDVTFADNRKAIFGAGSDLQIYHDGSNSIITDQGTGNLKINASSFEVNNFNDTTNIIDGNAGGAVRLYHANSQKFTTTSTGIDVTGTAVTDGLTVDGALTQDGGAVFNEASADVDFRVESNTNTHALFVQGSDGSVGIGTSSPAVLFQVSQGANATSTTIRLENTDTTITAAQTANAIEFYTNDSSTGGTGVTGKISHVAINAGSLYGLVFSAYNGSSLSEAMRIDSNGDILPGTDDAQDIGSGSKRFDDIHATNGTIQTSDRNEKQDIAELSDAEQRVAVACKGLLRKFRWKSAVAEKGDDARIHFGIIAQDLQDAFTAEGLDAGRYGMFINSTWTNEETGEERSRMGVRYSELLAFIIAAV